MWEECVTEWYHNMVQPLDWMGSVLIMQLCWFRMFLVCLWCMCLFHPCCVGHGGSGVAMEVLIVLLLTCYHECMASYVILMLVYCSCTIAYILYMHW